MASSDEEGGTPKYLLHIFKRSKGKEVTSSEKAVPTARKQTFVLDDVDNDDCEDDMSFDHVCSLCDDGGTLLWCDGSCMRSFHPTEDDGIASNCESLGLTDEEVNTMTSFNCQNCKHQRHQCFVCGFLGSSDVASGAEVFPCISATCGHFYHPACVAKLIHPEDATESAVLQNQIAAGEAFLCPAHRCSICKKFEDKTFHELQFAVCRRCPTSYHRKCMPESIRFDCTNFYPTRAWDGLLKNRVLIYCLKHEINPELQTPERNHILFSDTQRSRINNTSQLSGRMTNIGDSRKILLGSNMSKPVDCCSSKNVERGFSQACSGAGKSLNISVAKHPSKYFGILPREHWSDTDARGRNTPFLHDMRYTSYGRHFTKSEKLQEVVDRLHNYVLDGDTIVDFCCGSNDDFSLLMKKKLNEMGKCCSFRKNDIIQPKNDFCLEKRDWMSLTPKELPAGSKLIMWLNPPFEVKASMANKFINMALELNPKLLILFVREETKRLDDNYGYDLIWEDRKIFSGKSFYLPGSTDVCNKQIEQWNNSPPPLYLWSRSDWSNTHRNIATQHGHVFMVQGEANEHYDTGLSTFSNYLMEDSHGCYDEDYADIMPENVDIAGILDDISDLEYSNESEPDEVRGNKRKYNVSPEDTEPEPSGVESSIPVKKMVNHLFYEASSSKLSSVIMKPQMIRTTQGLMNWSQPVPAGSSSASGGGSQISSVGATVGDTNIYTNFNCPSANEVKYSTSSGPVNWQTNSEDQPYPYAPAPMQQNVDYNYHPASFPRVLREPYVPQYMPSGYVNPFASGSTPFFQSATTEDNLPPIPGLGTSARPYPGP